MIQHQQQLSLVLHWYLTLTTTAVPVPVLLTPAKGDQSVLVFLLNYYKMFAIKHPSRFLQCNNHNLCCWRRQLFQFFWHRQRGTTSQLLSPGLQTKTEPSLFSKIKFPNKSNNVFGQQRKSKKNDRDFIQSNKSENTMMLFDECVLIQNLWKDE